VALLEKTLGQNGRRAEKIENLEEAIRKGLSIAGREDLLCITGSLYTVGEAKTFFRLQGRT